MTVLKVAEPHAHILVVVGEIECSATVLLVLKPVAFVFFAVRKSVYAITLALPFHILTVVSVARFEQCTAFPVGFSCHNFSLVLPSVVCCARTEGNLLRSAWNGQKQGKHCGEYMFAYCMRFHFMLLYTSKLRIFPDYPKCIKVFCIFVTGREYPFGEAEALFRQSESGAFAGEPRSLFGRTTTDSRSNNGREPVRPRP